MKAFKAIEELTNGKIKKYYWLIALVFLIFPILYLKTMGEMSLSGKDRPDKLVEYSFRKLNITFDAPDEWAIFNAVGNADLLEGLQKAKIIEGAYPPGGNPQIKIFDLDRILSDQDENPIDSTLVLYLERINNNIDEVSDPLIDEESNYTLLSYSYPIDFIFAKDEVEIICKDWIGDQDDHTILFSICGTEGQWVWLDEFYYQILQSIDFNE